MTSSKQQGKLSSAHDVSLSGMEFIAHRGAPEFAPENTLASFSLALNMGMTSFELDVQLSKDSIPVVSHDYDLERTAGACVKIGNLTCEELGKYNVAAFFKTKFPPQKVPRLEEVLDTLGRRARLHVEIKNDGNPYPGIEKKILDLVNSKPGWHERIIISSSDFPTLDRTRALDKEIKIGVLVGHADFSDALEKARELKAKSIHLNKKKVTPEIMARTLRAGFRLLSYTVNTREEALLLCKMGVSGVFTDTPEICQAGWSNIGGTSAE